MQQVTLKSCFVNNKDAQGQPLITKKGDPYSRVVIETVNGNKASCTIWNNQPAKLAIASTWRPGDTIDVTLTQSGEYTNFDFEAVETPTPRPDNQNTPNSHSTTTPALKANVEAKEGAWGEVLALLSIIQKQNAVIIGMLQDQKTPEEIVEQHFSGINPEDIPY